MKTLKILLLVIAFLVAGLLGGAKFMFPYGRKATMPCMYGALVAYALDHGGWFPESEKGAYDALRRLYPGYCEGGELAGVSGSVKETKRALNEGKSLSGAVTSLVYIEGFRLDDPPNLAILWESRPGVYSSGKRNFFGGRSVLFVQGDVTNVPAANWAQFLQAQQRLRVAILTGRAGNTNRTPPMSCAINEARIVESNRIEGKGKGKKEKGRIASKRLLPGRGENG